MDRTFFLRLTVTIAAVLLCAGCYGGVDTGTEDAAVRDTGTDAGAAGKCAGVSCSGHGMCALAGGEPLCACDRDYYAEGFECLPLHGDGGIFDAGPGDDAGRDAAVGDTGADAGPSDSGTSDAGHDAGADAGTELCGDGKQNGNETDVDCGGSCCPCADGKLCISGQDCVSRSCKGGKCQAPTCSDGVKNGQECGVDCGGPCPTQCATERIILDVFDGSSPCSGGCSRDVQGGLLETGSWTPQDGASRLVYDFGRHVDCGRVMVEVENFDPWAQFQPRSGTSDPYTEFISLFDGLEDKPEDRFNHYSDFSQIDVVYPPACLNPPCVDENGNPFEPNYSKIKPNAGLLTACDWDSGRYCNDCMQQAKTHYVFELRWTPQGLSLYIDDVEQTYYQYPVYPNPSCTFTCRPKTPELKYLYVGRPQMDWQGYLVGPKYRRVELEATVD